MSDDKNKLDHLQMATLGEVKPPPKRSARSPFGAVSILLLAVIVLLLVLLLKPVKLDVYKTIAE